jgi:hypothetical protein
MTATNNCAIACWLLYVHLAILQVRRAGTAGASAIQVARHPLRLVVALHCTWHSAYLLYTRCNKQNL